VVNKKKRGEHPGGPYLEADPKLACLQTAGVELNGRGRALSRGKIGWMGGCYCQREKQIHNDGDLPSNFASEEGGGGEAEVVLFT